MSKILEDGVVMILRHREIVEECLEVREMSKNAAAGCFGVTQPVVLEANE